MRKKNLRRGCSLIIGRFPFCSSPLTGRAAAAEERRPPGKYCARRGEENKRPKETHTPARAYIHGNNQTFVLVVKALIKIMERISRTTNFFPVRVRGSQIPSPCNLLSFLSFFFLSFYIFLRTHRYIIIYIYIYVHMYRTPIPSKILRRRVFFSTRTLPSSEFNEI